MKKAIVALALAAAASAARATVAGSPHDLSNNTGSPWAGLGGQLSACQYCHAPHNTNTAMAAVGAPLWNRNDVTHSWQLYTSATLSSPTPTNNIPNANSMTCLSCHDGTTDMGATYTGAPGFATPTTIAALMSRYPTTANQGSNLGSDLRNDHPVSIQYPATVGTYKSVNSVLANKIKLYTYGGVSNYVECASCHDPHNYDQPGGGYTPFLRVQKSALCTTCHNY